MKRLGFVHLHVRSSNVFFSSMTMVAPKIGHFTVKISLFLLYHKYNSSMCDIRLARIFYLSLNLNCVELQSFCQPRQCTTILFRSNSIFPNSVRLCEIAIMVTPSLGFMIVDNLKMFLPFLCLLLHLCEMT